jgi:hypothetical protein
MFGMFFNETLNERMKRKLDEYNSETMDEYRHIVVYLSSDEILKKLNSNNLESIITVNMIIKDVGDALKSKYGFDEVVCFNNEISLIYNFEKQKMENKVLVFNGNTNKILTKLASEASCIFTKMINGALKDKNNYMFKGRYVEFAEEDEIENWKKWRRGDCERNIISYLYRMVITKNNASIKKEEMIEELNKYGILDQEEIKMILNI